MHSSSISLRALLVCALTTTAIAKSTTSIPSYESSTSISSYESSTSNPSYDSSSSTTKTKKTKSSTSIPSYESSTSIPSYDSTSSTTKTKKAKSSTSIPSYDSSTSIPSYGSTTTTKTTKSSTYSIPTATTAAPTASAPTVDDGKDYITYSTVGGYFLQDLNSTVPGTFDFTATNFGLINQTYDTDCSAKTAKLTQWQRFSRLIHAMNQEAPKNTAYKLLFIGRHGEGWHNAAQTYYGTPAWNCYWAELDGNATATWSDAHLTNNGIAQAVKANFFWAYEMEYQKITPPQSYYVSPLSRCLETANYTYSNLSLPTYSPFVPTVKEFFREGISVHTCDRRSNKTYIHESFPSYKIDPDMTENDKIWNGITAETSSAQDYRSKLVLDDVFSTDPSTVISVTTHSGEAASLLRVLGHIPFSLVTGEIIPVLVKAVTTKGTLPATTTVPWTTSAWCTNGAPLSSATTAPYQCVCSDGVEPTATTWDSAASATATAA